MNLASSSNFSHDAFGFLSTAWGQLVLGVGSVLLLLMVKNMTRPSNEHAFQRDDFAIGLDLLVLSLVTLVGYAVSQYIVQQTAQAQGDSNVADVASTNQINAGSLVAAILLVMIAVIWMIQRVGRYTPKEQANRNGNDRFRPFRGLILPDIIGAAMLFIAIKMAVG